MKLTQTLPHRRHRLSARARTALTAMLLLGALALSGCSGLRLIDSQVNSFAPGPVASGASYQFERLPSQQAEPQTQARIETMAETALAKVGLTRVDHNAKLSAQVLVTERVERLLPDGSHFGWRMGWMFGNAGISVGNQALFPGLADRPNYWREVRLTLRERATQSVVFESRASHDGPWADSEAVLPAMLDAALQGFPAPPPGERRVNIEIAR